MSRMAVPADPITRRVLTRNTAAIRSKVTSGISVVANLKLPLTGTSHALNRKTGAGLRLATRA